MTILKKIFLHQITGMILLLWNLWIAMTAEGMLAVLAAGVTGLMLTMIVIGWGLKIRLKYWENQLKQSQERLHIATADLELTEAYLRVLQEDRENS